MGVGIDNRNRMAKRAAEEIKPGMIVNLGIGIPSLVSNHLKDKEKVMFHAENGIVGIGPQPVLGEEDEHLCNAGGFPVTVVRGAAYFDSATAFAMIRSGRIDITILGALEVSKKGDLANWIVPGKKVPGMGGAMELAQKAKKVIVLMNQVDKHGRPKIVESCSLPLTSKSCVNLIITDMGVFRIENEHIMLIERFAPFTVSDIQAKTECSFQIDDSLKVID